MALPGLQPGEVHAIDAVARTPDERFLFQFVLRSLDDRAYMTDQVGSSRGFATAAMRAQGALQTFGRTGQPYINIVRDLVSYAQLATQQAIDVVPIAPLRQVSSVLGKALKRVNAAGDKKLSSQIATDLAGLLNEGNLQSVAGEMLEYVVKSSTIFSARHMAILGMHFSSVVALYGRSAASLILDLRNLAARPRTEGDTFACLMPQAVDFVFASVVEGTNALRSVDRLLPGASCLQPASRAANLERQSWGHGEKRLAEFLASSKSIRASCVVVGQIDAHDNISAAHEARRLVSEALDQYMAGHRLADLRVSDRVLVGQRRSGRTIEVYLGRPGVGAAYPLTFSWPAEINSALHAAHVLRSTTTPVTKSGFSWVVLEAAGLGDNLVQIALAKALALQSLRQNLLASFELLRQGVQTRHAIAIASAARAGDAVERAKRGLLHVPLDRVERRAELAEHERVAVTRSAESDMLVRDSAVASGALAEVLKALPLNRYNRLIDLNGWADLLSGSLSTSHLKAHQSLARIEPFLPELSAIDLAFWREVLSDSRRLEEWLDETRVDYRALLTSLKAVRNQALHTAESRLRGDASVAQGAEALVDLVFEFLGNWYDRATARATPLEPKKIILRLGARFDSLTSHLAPGGSIAAIDFNGLTSPLTQEFR